MGSEWLWSIGFSAIIFALAHILAAVGGAKTKSTVNLLQVVAAVFVLATIKFMLWGTAPIIGG